jgi:hypothetical protein
MVSCHPRNAVLALRARISLSAVMTGLDPGIHLLMKNDGLPDQVRQ